MRKMIYSLLFFLFIIPFCPTQAQVDIFETENVIDPLLFDSELMNQMIIFQINQKRKEAGLDSLKQDEDGILNKIAQVQADYMASLRRETEENEENKEFATLFARAEHFGATQNVFEVVKSKSAKRGRNMSTYAEIADYFIKKWFRSSRSAEDFLQEKYVYIGMGSAIDDRNKVYVSVVFGNYSSLNKGADRRKELQVPYTTKRYCVKMPESQNACRGIDRWDHIEDLNDGLYIKDGKIYFKHDDLRRFSTTFLRGKKDGLAVDIIQKAQFPCVGPNIIDYTTFPKGHLTKPVYSKKILKKSLKKAKKEHKQAQKKIKIKSEKVDFDERAYNMENILDVCIAKKIPEFPGPYDINLVIIQDKQFCISIPHAYFIEEDVTPTRSAKIVKDTTSIKITSHYVPVADSATLKFFIPFEVNKYEYEPEEIEPFIASLNEPDFIIKQLNISAHSSIEGSEEVNKMLQEKRAESITKAIGERQEDIIETNITTTNSWEMFTDTIKNTEWDTLATMSLDSAKSYIIAHNLLEDLEPILALHRYAKMEMKIEYDIEGEKEEPYVISKFNKSIQKGEDIALIKSIQDFIYQQIQEGKYDRESAKKMNIPQKQKYSPLLLNQYIFENNLTMESMNANDCALFQTLYEIDSTNLYHLYNALLCKIRYKPLESSHAIGILQKEINSLFDMAKEINPAMRDEINNLDLEFQFKIIEKFDTASNSEEENPIVVRAIEKIKRILDVEEATWQNSLKLATVVVKQLRDYAFAIEILRPYLEDENTGEELLFTYLSLTSHFPEMRYSGNFAKAMNKAAIQNPDRFCKLFGGEKFPYQVLENNDVKKLYCETCNQSVKK